MADAENKRDNSMQLTGKAGKAPALSLNRRMTIGRLLAEYTLLFAVFFAVVLSPFWLYGKTFFWGTDGLTQYLPELTYSRHWARNVFENLSKGHFDVPLWSLWVGLGQKTFDNVINYRLLNFLFCLFPAEALEQYQLFKILIGMYFTGLSFLAYGRTRVSNLPYLLMGCMMYLFGGFIPYYTTKHWLFLEISFAFPLMLLGVDQIFDGKWSWLFIIIVFKTAMSYFYSLIMITIPAVIYAVFHFFELDIEQRSSRGGLGRIFLRHVVQYVAGVCLAAVSLLPCLFDALGSSRIAEQSASSYLVWPGMIYLNFIRGIVDAQSVVHNGFIALPSAGIIAILILLYTCQKQDRLLLRQIVVYILAFLIPGLTMLFSLFVGNSMRWSYVFCFWTALCTAILLPRLPETGTRGYRFCAIAFSAYSVIYLCVCVLTGNAVSVSLVLAFLGMLATCWIMSKRGASQRLSVALLCIVLLVELTVKSYEWYSPLYGNHISNYANAGTVLAQESDSPAYMLKKASDDGVYRTDLITNTDSERRRLTNYGIRNHINGVSSYYNMNGDSLVTSNLVLANAHQSNVFMINDLDQRTVLDALTGVKYAVTLEDGLPRMPYGYRKLISDTITLSDGTQTNAYLYENSYALPIAYTYSRCIPYEAYAALPPNRKEQAMLQGVVLEDGALLDAVTPVFDDRILMDTEGIRAAIESIADNEENLEVGDGKLRVKKANYTLTIPVESTAGEIYLQFQGLQYHSVNFYSEEARKREENGESRMRIMTSKRNARQWQPIDSAVVTATSGALSDSAKLLGEDNQYFYGRKDVLLNLGYGEIKKNVKIKFSEPGEYRFDSVSLICQPMESYAEKIAPLQANGALTTQVNGNRVTLQFKCDGDALACLAIPYDMGWSARVDGEAAEIMHANVAFMGVKLTKGTHTVEFSYMPKGLKPGAAISLATLVALIGVGVYRVLRRRRGRA